MTLQEWKKVEESLKSFFSIVKLKCDEYEVSLCLERIGQMKNGIFIYVNGVFKGKWLVDDCEERRRFARPVKKAVYSRKQKANMGKISKRLRKKYGLPDIDDKITYYSNYWTCFKSLKSHLIKNNSNIELVREQSVADSKVM